MQRVKEPDDLGELADNMKQLLQEYYSLQRSILRLNLIRYLAKGGGAVMDTMVSVILLFLVIVFAAITGALWLSKLTGSYPAGFGLMTGILLVISLLIHLFRKVLFVNPIIHKMVKKLHAEPTYQTTENEKDESDQ